MISYSVYFTWQIYICMPRNITLPLEKTGGADKARPRNTINGNKDEQTEHYSRHDTMGLKTWNMSLDKLVNIGPITQPSVGDNLRLFLVLFIAIFNNSSVVFTAVNCIGGGNRSGVPGKNHQMTDKLVKHVKLQRAYT